MATNMSQQVRTLDPPTATSYASVGTSAAAFVVVPHAKSLRNSLDRITNDGNKKCSVTLLS